MTMLVPLQATISTVVVATGDRAIANVFESVFGRVERAGSLFLSSRVRSLFRIDRRCAAQQKQLDCFVITVSSRRSARNLSPCEGFVSRPVIFFGAPFFSLVSSGLACLVQTINGTAQNYTCVPNNECIVTGDGVARCVLSTKALPSARAATLWPTCAALLLPPLLALLL